MKILDFGLALVAGEWSDEGELTDEGQAMGTADYIAPEQVSDAHSVDIRADVYSLGCTLYKLLTGHAPFTGAKYRTRTQKLIGHFHDTAPPVEGIRPEVSVELAAVIERMMSKSPGERYATPAGVAAALAPFVGGCDLAALLAKARTQQSGPDSEKAVSKATGPLASSGVIGTDSSVPAARAQASPEEAVSIATRSVSEASSVGRSAREGLTPGQSASVEGEPEPPSPGAWPLSLASRTGPSPTSPARPSLSLRAAMLNALRRRPVAAALRILTVLLLFAVAIKVAMRRGTIEITTDDDADVAVQQSDRGDQVEVKVTLKRKDPRPPARSAGKEGTAAQSAGEGPADWPPGPAEDALPGLVPRPARLPGVGRWQLLTRQVVVDNSHQRTCTSPDGRRFAFIADSRNEIRIYGIDTWRLQWVLLTAEPPTEIQFSPDGQWLASQLGRRAIQLWDVARGKAGPKIQAKDLDVGSFAWAPDSRRLVVSSLQPKQPARIWQTDGQPGPTISQNALGPVCWGPDGEQIALTERTEKGFRVRVCSLSGGPDRVLDATVDVVEYDPRDDLAWSPNGRWLAVAEPMAGTATVAGSGPQRKIRFWDTRGWTLAHSVSANCARRLVWSRDSQHLTAVGEYVYFFDIENRSPTPSRSLLLPGVAGGVVAGPGNGDFLMTAHEGVVLTQRPYEKAHMVLPVKETMRDMRGNSALGHIAVSIDVASEWKAGMLSKLLLLRDDGKRCRTIEASCGLETAEISPDGKWVAFVVQGNVFAARTEEDKPVRRLTAEGGRHVFAWRPDSKFLAIGGEDGSLQVHYLGDGFGPKVLPGHQAKIDQVAWSPDGALVASASRKEGKVRIWGAAGPNAKDSGYPGFRPVCDLEACTAHFCWSPDSRRIATAVGKELRTWNVADGKPDRAPAAHPHEVKCVAWSPDGKWIAAVNEGRVDLWGSAGERGPTMPCAYLLAGVVWSPNSQWLAAFGADECAAASLWHVSADRFGPILRAPSSNHRLYGWKAHWQADSLHLITGTNDGALRFWNVETGEHLRTIVVFDHGEVAAISQGGRLELTDPSLENELSYLVEASPGVLRAYTPAEFRALRRTGIPAGASGQTRESAHRPSATLRRRTSVPACPAAETSPCPIRPSELPVPQVASGTRAWRSPSL